MFDILVGFFQVLLIAWNINGRKSGCCFVVLYGWTPTKNNPVCTFWHFSSILVPLRQTYWMTLFLNDLLQIRVCSCTTWWKLETSSFGDGQDCVSVKLKTIQTVGYFSPWGFGKKLQLISLNDVVQIENVYWYFDWRKCTQLCRKRSTLLWLVRRILRICNYWRLLPLEFPLQGTKRNALQLISFKQVETWLRSRWRNWNGCFLEVYFWISWKFNPVCNFLLFLFLKSPLQEFKRKFYFVMPFCRERSVSFHITKKEAPSFWGEQHWLSEKKQTIS